MRKAITLAVVLLLCFALGQESLPAPQAVVVYTDGTTLKGRLSTPDEGPLRVYDVDRKRYVRIRLSDILQVNFEVEKRQIKEAWRWKEPGKPVKVYLGKKYPWIKLMAHVRLRDGRLLRAHIAAQLYLVTEDGVEHRVRLLTYLKGKYGQKFSDLRWVRSIRFPNAKPTKPAVLEGKIQPEGLVRALYAVRQETGEVFRAEIGKDASSYRFDALLPGVYDLVVVTDHQVRFGLGMKGEKGAGEALDEGAKKALVDYINSIEEFCEEKMVTRICGGRSWCRVFMRKVRRRKAHGEQKRGEPYLFVEWEFAWLASAGGNWHMVRRSEVFREKFPARLEHDRLREPVFCRSLSDIDLRSGGTLTHDIKIGGK